MAGSAPPLHVLMHGQGRGRLDGRKYGYRLTPASALLLVMGGMCRRLSRVRAAPDAVAIARQVVAV